MNRLHWAQTPSQYPVLTSKEWILSVLSAAVLILVAKAAYNVYLHPLSRFPGPKLAAASTWWQVWVELIKGESWSSKLVELHGVYGDVLRIGPNELHFANPQAYHEIYNQTNRWLKEKKTYCWLAGSNSFNTMSILDYDTAKKRRDITAPLFSRKSVMTLQPVVQAAIDAMCENIDEHIKAGTPFSLFKALRCSVVDTILAVCFGRNLDTARTPQFNASFVHALHGTLAMIPPMKHFPLLRDVIHAIPKSIPTVLPQTKEFAEFAHILEEQIREIKEDPEALADYSHRTIYHEFLKDPDNIPSDGILRDEAILFISAGTDTTSDALTLGMVNVLHDTQIYARSREEIDILWPQIDQPPQYEALEKLPYLTAVIKESLRVGLGVAHPMMRIVPPAGAQISGESIPSGTSVGISNVLVHWNKDIFPEPHAFKPEQWLDSNESVAGLVRERSAKLPGHEPGMVRAVFGACQPLASLRSQA